MGVDLKKAKAAFERQFGGPPSVGAAAPGRVNLIGEHTDYNHGFVMPMALERETVLLARPREDLTLNAWAAVFREGVELDLADRSRREDRPWVDYVLGVADELAKMEKPLTGMDVLITGDVPIGAGLSSSASFEMAALRVFEALGGFELDGPEGARLGQRVENDYLGLQSGIMDQFIVRMAGEGHALFLDCRSHAFELVPAELKNAVFVVADTGISRGLTASKYNERVAECREAVEQVSAIVEKPATHLRDLAFEDVEQCREHLGENVFRRARHVITENERTEEARDAMRAGDLELLGRLMTESHESLRLDYEVTCPELDALVEIAIEQPGCYGARMTGAGFGGCTVSLVEAKRSRQFTGRLLKQYQKQTGQKGDVLVSKPAPGARLLQL